MVEYNVTDTIEETILTIRADEEDTE